MTGVFVQVNTDSRRAKSQPVGYVIVPSGCWEWTGVRDRKGYGRLRDFAAHRWVYEQAKGPVPMGLQIDHLCRNRCCVNPDHMEPVTPRENVLRGDSPRLSRERRLRKSRNP